MAENKAPRLSIVMPVFNHREQVRVMIDSIIANTYDDWELLAVDDGSEDDTVQLLADYERKDQRIRLIKRQRMPKGAPTCRNIGMDEARGEYIVFFDSDDYIAPYCLAGRVEAMDKREELDFMVFPSGVYRDNTGFQTGPNTYAYGYPGLGDEAANFARRFLPFIVWNNIYRTASLRYYKIRWDEQLLSLQDADFNVATIIARLKFDYALNIGNVKPDYGYRLGTSASVSKGISSERQFESHVYATRKMYEMIRAAYGNKYDGALFSGVLALYNLVMTGRGLNASMAEKLIRAINDLAPIRSRLLSLLVSTSCLLSKIFPAKMSRQLPMAPYLLSHVWRKRRKVAIIKRY